MVSPAHVLGRYALYGEIAAGGMATVYFGRLVVPVGFSRTVAIKRLHPQFAKDPEFVAMLLDEARIAARIRHPNVVPTLDVMTIDGELLMIMEYVNGEPFGRLARHRRVPPRIAAAILCDALRGLHAAHETLDERGEPLNIVHRDVSPQNILVGVDGTARLLDFGVAKASGRSQAATRQGDVKGKIAYMAPEQFHGQVTRQTDVYAASIIAWEALTGARLFAGNDELETMRKAMSATVVAPSTVVPDLPAGLDDVLLRGLSRSPKDRWPTARDLSLALEKCLGIASPTEVAEWVDGIAHNAIVKRAATVSAIEASSTLLAAEAAPPASTEAARVVESSATHALSRPADSGGLAPAIFARGAAAPRARRRWLTAMVMLLAALNLFLVARRLLYSRHFTANALVAPSEASPLVTASPSAAKRPIQTAE